MAGDKEDLIMYSTEAIILKNSDIGEYDCLISILSKDYGKVILRARGVRKNTSKLRGHLESLNFSRVSFVFGRYMPQLTGAEVITSHANLRSSEKFLFTALYLAFLVDSFCEPGERLSKIWRMLSSSLEILNEKNMDDRFLWILSRQFEASLINTLGFAPLADKCVVCGDFLRKKERLGFSFEDSAFVHTDCRISDFAVAPAEYEIIKEFLSGSKEKLRISLKKDHNGRLIGRFFKNYLGHLGGRQINFSDIL